MSKARRTEAEQRGRRGETLAVWWLRLTGWRILGRRLRVGAGEVDIVARRGGVVAFVEVKWRARAADLDFAVDTYRLRRVARAAEVFAGRFARHGDTLRIDVILLAPNRWPRRIAHVWQPGAA